MGKIQNLITNLAESSNKPTPAPKIGAEIGTSANTAMSSILGFDFDDDNDIKVEQFKAMLDNDGTVQALYNMIVMPKLEFHIVHKNKKVEIKNSNIFCSDRLFLI